MLCLLALWLTMPAGAAQRVISPAPNATELAYAAGMGDVLVAASAYSDYPPQAAKLEQVASGRASIWSGCWRSPDLILARRGGNPQRVLDQLAAFGIPIFYADADTLEGIAGLLDKLAQYSPHPEQAHQAAEGLRRQFAALKQQYAANPSRRVLLQFGTQPLFTSAGATLQSSAGAVRRAERLRRQPHPLAADQPRAGVGAPAAGHRHHRGAKEAASVKAFWAPQLQVPVIALNEDWFNRGGPRIALAAQQLCRQLAEIR